MKRIVLIAIIYLLAVTARGNELHGSWIATKSDDGRIHLEMSYGDRNRNGHSYDLSALAGLTASQIAASGQTPVTFEMKRDAGTLAFHGSFENGDGAGHFTFTPNSGYFAALEKMGVRLRDSDHDKTDDVLLSLAACDVSLDFIRGMKAEGYDVSAEEYLTMRIFDVSRELLAQYRKLGYDKIPFDQLIGLRVHRVTPDYIDKMRAAGYPKASLDELVDSRIHRATPEFIAELRAAGYSNLEFSDLIAFRIHRVTPESIRDLHSLGYDHLTPQQLVDMQIHRVTPQYIREIEAAGYSHVPAEKLIEMRIHGIDSEMIRKMK